MKRSRFLTCGFGACMIALLAASVVGAQQDPTTQTPTTPTNGGTTTTTTTTSPAGGGGGGGGGGSGASNPGDQNSITMQPLDVSATKIYAVNTGAGTATSIPSNANILVGTYVDPRSLGMPANFAASTGGTVTPKGTFGLPLYGNQGTTTPATANRGAATTAANQQGTGFSTAGIVRAPAYATVLSEDELPIVVHAAPALQSNIRAALDRSSFLSNKKGIEVIVNGNVVELRGQVADAREFRIAAGLASTTPGVASVVNQLQIVNSKQTASRVP